MTKSLNLESFVEGMRETTRKIKEITPDHIFFPMLGSLPFSDIMNLIDPEFPADRSEYIPASISRGFGHDITGDWLYNFIDSINPQKPTKLIFVDEVKSGNCIRALSDMAQRAIKDYGESKIVSLKSFVFKNRNNDQIVEEITRIDNTLQRKYTNELKDISGLLISRDEEKNREGVNCLSKLLNDYFSNLIIYSSIAIEHQNGELIQHKEAYNQLIRENKIIPIKVNEILTMDKPELTPARYKMANQHHIPEIEMTFVSQEYRELLGNIAAHMGINISDKSFPVNEFKILNSSKYLSRYYKKSKK